MREPWEDKIITCEEMQRYPERVFAGSSPDLGAGSVSPNEVDYGCEGGLESLPFIKKLYALADQIRSDDLPFICSGSSVHVYRRHFHYDLLKAGLAPDLNALHNEEWEEDAEVYQMYGNALKYFRLWAHQSLYNFELHEAFWKEYHHVKPALITHYQDRFKVPYKKATYYADNALSNFVRWAAGSYYYDLQDGKPNIKPIEEALANPKTTRKNIADMIEEQNVSQEELDDALKAALLYQRPQSMLEMLLKKGARINSGDESALFFALRNRENVMFFLKHGAEVNYANGFGKTALFYAIGFNDIYMVQLLIDHKADVNHTYISKRALEQIRLDGIRGEWNIPFYQSYCSITHGKRTPLMHAAQHGNVALIKLLLKRGAKLDALDDREFNAADYARMGNKPENRDYLKSLGLRENRPDET